MKKNIVCFMVATMLVASVPASAFAIDSDFVIDDNTELKDGEEVGDYSNDEKDKSDKDDSKGNKKEETNPEEVAEINPFKDVAATDWCYEYVMDTYKKGLMSGTGSDEFSPNASLTRGMVASIIYRMAGSPNVEYKATFTDVPSGQWYSNGIIWASENGVISGYGNGKCGPNDSVTVEQLASLLYRYAGSPVLAEYVDENLDVSDVSDYAVTAMRWSYRNEMLHGETLHAKTPATRAEAAKMFSLFKK